MSSQSKPDLSTLTPITWKELRDKYGFETPAHGHILRAEITHRTEHWNRCKLITAVDTSGEEGSIAFYVDDLPYGFDFEEMVVGNTIGLRSPRLHYFMDRTMGMRVEESRHLVQLEKAYFSDDQRVRFASVKKDKGNVCFKDKRYEDALDLYDTAVSYCDLTRESTQACKDIAAACHLNIAACHLAMTKKRNLEAVEPACRKVLALSSKPEQQAKAWFRMGDAAYQLTNYREAMECLGKALACSPGDPDISVLYDKVQREMADMRKTDEKLFKWQHHRGVSLGGGVTNVWGRCVYVGEVSKVSKEGNIAAVVDCETDLWVPAASPLECGSLSTPNFNIKPHYNVLYAFLITVFHFIPAMAHVFSRFVMLFRSSMESRKRRAHAMLTGKTAENIASTFLANICTSTQYFPLLIRRCQSDPDIADIMCLVFLVLVDEHAEVELCVKEPVASVWKSIVKSPEDVKKYVAETLKVTPQQKEKIRDFFSPLK